MRKIIAIFIDDIKRICKRPAAVVILLGLLVVPGIYAWLNIDSNWDPYSNTGKLPIAVVNKDKGATILGEELNMGDLLEKSLKENKDMNWVFTNEKEAKRRVENNDFYGDIVIPENFSEKLITVFSNKKIERPEFDFYVNHKKNPIAPIIVNKAVSAIQNTINQNIVNAIIFKTLSAADDYDIVTKAANSTDQLINRLNKAKTGLSDLRAVFKTLTITADLTSNSLTAFKELLPTVDSITGSTQDGITNIQSAVGSFNDLTNDVDAAFTSLGNDAKEVADIIDSFDTSPHEENKEIISGKVDDISLKLKEKSEKVAKVRNTLSKISENIKLTNFEGLQTKLQKLQNDIDDAHTMVENTKKTVDNVKETKNNIIDVRNRMRAIEKDEVEAYKTYKTSIKKDLDSAYDNANKSMDSVNELMAGINQATSKTDKALDSMIKAMGNTKDLTDNVDVVFKRLQSEIDKIVDTLSGKKEGELYDKFVNLMESDPVEVANFISNPVKTNEIDLYYINTYGSKMAPFYTVLASWVGCTLLISIIKTDIENTHLGQGQDKLKNYQKFFGRFLLFGTMAMTQGLIIGIGDILLKVQVINIPLFLLTIMTSSLVFMLFVFSMTISFGKVGEAFTIVVMVLQVAGSGGTFPIELLPRAFAVLQPVMPFYPAMNVLRETIGGFYGHYYIYYMAMLLAHTIVPLLLGLLFRTPIIHLKQKLDRELEKTGIII
jgi:putative membrane protein